MATRNQAPSNGKPAPGSGVRKPAPKPASGDAKAASITVFAHSVDRH